MAHDVFISYSSKNEEYASAVHEKLQSNGIKCWLDSSNIRTASNFAQEIVDALNEAKVLVLIYSKDSDDSKYVYREVETAFDNIPIVPLKIDETFPENLEFFLRNTQWLDASPAALKKRNATLEDCYDDLVDAVRGKISHDSRPASSANSQGIVIPHEKSFTEKYGKYIIALVVVLIVVGGYLAYSGMNEDNNKEIVNETGIDIGYIGLQNNGGSYSYNVYGTVAEGSNYTSSDVIHIEFYDQNGKVVDTSDTKVSNTNGNILGSIESSNNDVSKVTVELQNKDKKVLFTQDSENIVEE